jgi:uncharacterized membrane protein YqjE
LFAVRIQDNAPSSGFAGSLRALGDGVLGSLQERVELLSIELQEEKLRVIQTLAWIAAAMFLGALALIFASATLVYLFWESGRLFALVGLTVCYTVATIAAVIRLRRFLARLPVPFEATLDELKRDRECIRDER